MIELPLETLIPLFSIYVYQNFKTSKDALIRIGSEDFIICNEIKQENGRELIFFVYRLYLQKLLVKELETLGIIS